MSSEDQRIGWRGERVMGYEVDFIGVGEQSKSGDAIALRWGNLAGDRSEQRVVIIDGGFKESGTSVVDVGLRYARLRSTTTEHMIAAFLLRACSL